MTTDNKPYFPFESMKAWEQAFADELVEGLFVSPQGVLMFDRRYKQDSAPFRRYGPRTADLGINGPEIVAVPAQVSLDLIMEVEQLREEVAPMNGIH